ncbi:MAG: NAD-binding oxidoreductase, partial [Pseudomonadota bacterium]
MRFFSDASRPVHLGPFPLERLARRDTADIAALPRFEALRSDGEDAPESLAQSMAEYQAMMDAIRDGLVNKSRADCPDDPTERANHLKAFGYFSDSAMVGVCRLDTGALLETPIENPGVARLAHDLRTLQTKTLASGIDLIMADLKDAMSAPPRDVNTHTHAIVFMTEMHRDPEPGERGTDWLGGAQAARAALRSAETAVVVANYIRLLGWDAKAHTMTATDVDLGRLSVLAGLTHVADGALQAPFLGRRFGLSAITTTFELTTDRPLAPKQPMLGPRWWLGYRTARGALNGDPYKHRYYVDGPHPFETLKRVDEPTTFIDEPRVPRVPKRTDMFARAQFGDMGKTLQDKGAKHASLRHRRGGLAGIMSALCIILQRLPHIDEPRVPRVPKRTDMFARAQFG